MSQLLDSLLYCQPLPQYLLANARTAEFVRADAGIAEPEIDESIQFAINDLCAECGRAERAMQSGDNEAAHDIMISAARALIATLEDA